MGEGRSISPVKGGSPRKQVQKPLMLALGLCGMGRLQEWGGGGVGVRREDGRRGRSDLPIRT